jgi:hypothetical protein
MLRASVSLRVVSLRLMFVSGDELEVKVKMRELEQTPTWSERSSISTSGMTDSRFQ